MKNKRSIKPLIKGYKKSAQEDRGVNKDWKEVDLLLEEDRDLLKCLAKL